MGDRRDVQALVLVDMQSAFVAGSEAVPSAAGLLAVVAGLLRAARASDALVVHVQNDGPAGAVDEPGSPGWQLHLPIARRGKEVVVRKSGDDGFESTDLAGVLARHGIERLAVCGVMSEMCVSATARSALARGYRVILPHDGHATYDIPALAGIAEMVPHTMVSRVAEWALGSEIDIIAHAADIRFEH